MKGIYIYIYIVPIVWPFCSKKLRKVLRTTWAVHLPSYAMMARGAELELELEIEAEAGGWVEKKRNREVEDKIILGAAENGVL